MEDSTLLIRHLPKDLSQDERKDLLHHIGATQVRLMGREGHMVIFLYEFKMVGVAFMSAIYLCRLSVFYKLSS